MSAPIVFDIETQYTLQEVGYDHKKLKVSVVGIYDYATDKYQAYLEGELPQLFSKMEHASFLIGFNSNRFDLPVLSPYYLGNIFQFSSLDLLEEVEKSLGFRVALDDLARATLGEKKSGHGFLAIEYYQKKEFDKLKEYCLHDVELTKKLFEYGKEQKKLLFLTSRGVKNISVKFGEPKKTRQSVSLSLPF